MKKGENVEKIEKFSNNDQVGGCMIINDGDSFSCDVQFDSPPSELLLSPNYDDSAPSLTTSCSSGSANQGMCFFKLINFRY